MTAAVRDRPASAGTGNGGVPARRAAIRWAWRLLRREWRQQLLILALITVAVAATFVASAVATDAPPPAGAAFGTAQDRAVFPGSTPHLATRIAALAHRFGPVDVIENESIPIPGSVQNYDLRAQNPHGPFGQPLLSLVSGHYPAGPGQVALTSALAGELRLRAGGTLHAGGRAWQVAGTVVNPQNTLDAFALVAPGQVSAPGEVTVLFDAHGVPPASIGPDVTSVALAVPENVINPETISLAAATLGMLLIALVGVGGFTVLAQRRLRSIGMLAAQGATGRHIRLVVRANGAATGLAGAGAGFVLGLAAWLAYRPQVEASSHHEIGALQLPWLVIVAAMVLAVVAAYLAAARPARAIARVPIVAALSGRPAPPGPARRWAVPAGLVLLAVAFFLLGSAGATLQGGMGQAVLGLVAVAVAVVLLSPACLAVLARAARNAPVSIRLALRDLARYRTRSGSALGAISLSVLVAVIICVASAARFGNALDYAGPNLAPNQLVLRMPAGPGAGPGGALAAGPGGRLSGHRRGPGAAAGVKGGPGPAAGGSGQPRPTSAAAAAAARRIAAAVGARQLVPLEQAIALPRRAATGRQWTGPLYAATPQLLRAFGIRASGIRAGADLLTMRPGLSTMTRMQLLHGDFPAVLGASGAPGEQRTFPCPASVCLTSPVIQQVDALPSGTSAPNTVLTEHAIRQLHLQGSIFLSGWLIQTPGALTASQIRGAEQAAAAAGLTVESRNSIPSLSQITDAATVFGILLALGILAMSAGLVRSETASDLRTLAATGASGPARRTIAATTAGALALTGAVIGLGCGYLAAIGFFRTNHLDGLSSLSSVPVTDLLAILIGMPLTAAIAGWLLGGREPAALGRRALE